MKALAGGPFEQVQVSFHGLLLGCSYPFLIWVGIMIAKANKKIKQLMILRYVKITLNEVCEQIRRHTSPLGSCEERKEGKCCKRMGLHSFFVDEREKKTSQYFQIIILNIKKSLIIS
jgi:hypothetical protein